MTAKTPFRTKHVPHRTCVGCGTVAAKRTLIRVVRTAQGEVRPDTSGKEPGRGVYLCANRQCWEQGVKKRRLERSLKTKLSLRDIDGLRAFAASLGLAAGETE